MLEMGISGSPAVRWEMGDGRWEIECVVKRGYLCICEKLWLHVIHLRTEILRLVRFRSLVSRVY